MPTAIGAPPAAMRQASLNWRLGPPASPCPASPPSFASVVFLPPYPVHRCQSLPSLPVPWSLPAAFCCRPPSPTISVLLLPDRALTTAISSSSQVPSVHAHSRIFSSPQPVIVLSPAGALSSCLPSSSPSETIDHHPWPIRSPPTSLSQPRHYPSKGYFELPWAALPASSLRLDHLILATSSLLDLPSPFFPLSTSPCPGRVSVVFADRLPPARCRQAGIAPFRPPRALVVNRTLALAESSFGRAMAMPTAVVAVFAVVADSGYISLPI